MSSCFGGAGGGEVEGERGVCALRNLWPEDEGWMGSSSEEEGGVEAKRRRLGEGLLGVFAAAEVVF